MFHPVILMRLAGLLLLVGFAARMAADLATRWSIAQARKRNALADVNERSSHADPTPRLGGVGIAAGLLIGFAILALMISGPDGLPLEMKINNDKLHWFGWMQFAAFVIGTYGAFALGLIDDVKGMGALKKLSTQAALALIPPLMGLRIEQIHLPGMTGVLPLPIAASVLLTWTWLLVMMNAVNFMDGINGLAGRFAQITVGAAFLGLVGFARSEAMLPLCAALYGACDGFLKHNSPVAKTFMGDCGSQMIGMYLGLLGVHVTQIPMTYPMPFIGFLIIVSLFVFDVLATMIRRAMRGKNLLKAHREHFYQRHLIANGGDHSRTLFFVDGYLFALAAIGAIYLHFAFGTHGTMAILQIPMTMLQAGLIILAVGTLSAYARNAIR
ncbi:undecaprenyl/decaprenyl-phosphate alpha-N-acetylglucosaminyl 1-phosphate transferase [Candidatus Sumerlaeota bacterium]|nr:undecaprenyl/decaprenyl-phosphate alpha-N-acetylglucosaminyl 1-phosphate transferase [Candidatus Sumerlaeota bacterium]